MSQAQLIQGRYQLLDVIGRGGMGEVWRARDESLGRRVAVKCLKPLTPQDDQSFTQVVRERFRREARVAARLQHRGVTVVHDFGEHEGVLYLVMELLDGNNLSQLMSPGGPAADGSVVRRPLQVTEIEEIAEQVALALAYTHEQGIVHRDLKPANIMVLTDGTVKICDFGIARLGHDVGLSQKLTIAGMAMGTPHYMSPEQIGGSDIDHRSDLYSLGCVLYEIATGAPPFNHEDPWAVLMGHRDTPPEPPRRRREELPGWLEQVILDLLGKNPDARPHDARELARRIRVGRAGAARANPVPPARTEPATPSGQGGALRQPTMPGGAGLPPWTAGMSTGPKASGSVPGIPPATPPGTPAGLSSAWTGAPGAPADGAPGSDDPAARLTAGHEAGLELGRQGRWSEAVDTHGVVAAERARLLGPDHPDTLASRYELAFSLSRTGRPAAALREYGAVSAGRARVLGHDHSDTLAALQETAFELGQLGRHDEAYDVYAAVLAARERTVGPEHPDTLRCRHNLAYSLSRLGRLDESFRMAYDVAVARVRILGPHHPDTLVTQYEVAYVLGLLGRWPDALEIYRMVATARAHVLGPDHPDTLAARYEIGISLGRLGRSAEALELYRKLAEDRARVHGPQGPETLRARHGVGVNLGRLGRWEEALAEARDVAGIRAQVLGADHPDTLVSRREVAVALGWLGRWNDALPEYRAVGAARARSLGEGHPDALTALGDEAHCLEQLGRKAEAAEIYRRITDLRSRTGGWSPGRAG